MDQVASSARPRASRLQFSLRLLLVAITAFAIGFPIWYRWPYRETHVESLPWSTQTTTRTTTWQRQWGGGRLKHGVERLEMPNGKEFTLRFASGRLTHVDGKPASNRLLNAALTGAMDDRTAAELFKFTNADFVEQPLKDVVMFLGDLHNLLIVMDQKVVPSDMPITANYRGIDLASALTLMMEPHKLSCDYRYGCIWITTADDTRDWHDPTGVETINPPKGSTLEKIWNKPGPTFDIAYTSLAQVLDVCAQELAVEIDTTRIQKSDGDRRRPLVTANMRSNLPWRHDFGQLLYKTGCRCKLNGETLVILPPK